MHIDTHINDTIDIDIIDVVIVSAITAWALYPLAQFVTKTERWMEREAVSGLITRMNNGSLISFFQPSFFSTPSFFKKKLYYLLKTFFECEKLKPS